MSDDLDTLSPVPLIVPAGGHQHALLPVAWRDVPTFGRAIKSLLGDEVKDAGSVQDMSQLIARIDWDRQLESNYDSLTDAVCIGAGLTAEELAGYAWTDVVALAAGVVRVNLDFFIRRALPAVTAALGAISQGMSHGDGSTPSRP